MPHLGQAKLPTVKAAQVGFFVASTVFLIASQTSARIAESDHIETAAIINVAENICDINFGDRLLHHVMLAAAEMDIQISAAARLADRRHTEIVSYLSKNRKLDEFCDNAKAGRLR